MAEMVDFLYKPDRFLHVAHPITHHAVCGHDNIRLHDPGGWRLVHDTPAHAVRRFGRICHWCRIALVQNAAHWPHYAALLTAIESDGSTPKWHTAEDQS